MRQMGGDFGGLSGLPLHSGVLMCREKFESGSMGWSRDHRPGRDMQGAELGSGYCQQ